MFMFLLLHRRAPVLHIYLRSLHYASRCLSFAHSMLLFSITTLIFLAFMFRIVAALPVVGSKISGGQLLFSPHLTAVVLVRYYGLGPFI